MVLLVFFLCFIFRVAQFVYRTIFSLSHWKQCPEENNVTNTTSPGSFKFPSLYMKTGRLHRTKCATAIVKLCDPRYETTLLYECKKSKGSSYSVAERRVPELILVLGSQPAGDVSYKPGGRLPLLSARPAVTPATLKRTATVLLLGEQRHDGCEQFA